MKRFILKDDQIFMNVVDKELAKEIYFFTKDVVIGKLFFLKINSALAGVILNNEIWIIEREGEGFEASQITVNNVKENDPYLVVDLEVRSSNAISVFKEGLSVVFYKTSYWKDTWAWVDVITNENVIEFETGSRC